MNRRILTLPLAVSLVAGGLAPAAVAATVGPNEGPMVLAANGICMLKLNDREAATYSAWANVSTQEVYANAAVKAFEVLYPGTESIVREFRAEPSLAELVEAQKNLASRLADAKEAQKRTEQRYTERLQQVGMEHVLAQHLTEELTKVEVWAVKPSIKQGSISERPVSALGVEEANRVRGKRVNRQDFEDVAWKSFVVQGNLSQSDLKTFRKTFLAADDVQLAIGGTTAYLEVDMNARVACADGGNREVKYPTSIDEVRNWNIDSLRGEAGLSSLSSQGEVEVSPLAIVGLVVGVLAALGIAVAAVGPSLGIPLPALPKLPGLPF